MRASLILASLGAVIAATQAGGTAMAALDNEQFCTAMSEISDSATPTSARGSTAIRATTASR